MDSHDRSWIITGRWQQYEGELRANLLRIVAIGAFYLIHLWNYLGSRGDLPVPGLLQLNQGGPMDRRFHVLVSLLALAWVAMATSVHLALRNRLFPRWLSTVTTTFDLAFLTGVICIAGGPRSPLVVGYFLVIALAALRFDVRLVRLATIGSALGYVCLLGCARWPATFGRDVKIDIGVPRYHQLVVLVGIVLCGIFTGQVVRRTRRIAEHYAMRVKQLEEESP